MFKSDRSILTARYVVSMDPKGSVYSPGYVEIKGDRIQSLGELKDAPRSGTRTDYGNAAIIPGLINSHTHAAMTLFRGFADDLALSEWLQMHIWPLEGKFLSPAFVRAGTRLAAMEMLKAGVTMFADMYFFEEEVALACREAGIRVLLGEGILGFSTPSARDPEKTFDNIIRLKETYKDDELVRLHIAAHSTYATLEDHLYRCAELASLWNLPVQIHCAETEDEVKECRQKRGKSQVQYLESLGLMDIRIGLVHMVWPQDEDWEYLKRENVSVVSCPQSNLKLGSGIPPLHRYCDEGVRIVLGTDGAASNNNLDIWEEMRLAALIAKGASLNPTKLSAKMALRLVTADAAHAWGLDEIGSLETEKKADVVVVNLEKPHNTPCYDVYSSLVYSTAASDVRDVYVSGRRVLRDGILTTLNEETVLTEAKGWAERIKTSLSGG